ncbi:MAG: hypothetical protein AAGN35_26445 [Bacteroidota bacterium]
MTKSTELLIKVVCVCLVFLPYKFIILAGAETSFLLDFFVALLGYALAYGVVYLLQRGRSGDSE